MVALLVKAGTPVKVLPAGALWTWNNLEPKRTTQDLMFFAEHIAVDPLGHIGVGPDAAGTASEFAAAGWYGFLIMPKGHDRRLGDERHFPTMLVPGAAVEAR
jgi:hypothetical protein